MSFRAGMFVENGTLCYLRYQWKMYKADADALADATVVVYFMRSIAVPDRVTSL